MPLQIVRNQYSPENVPSQHLEEYFLPKKCEDHCNHHRQNFYRPMLSLLIDLDEAIYERRQPQEPFEECSYQYGPDN